MRSDSESKLLPFGDFFFLHLDIIKTTWNFIVHAVVIVTRSEFGECEQPITEMIKMKIETTPRYEPERND